MVGINYKHVQLALLEILNQSHAAKQPSFLNNAVILDPSHPPHSLQCLNNPEKKLAIKNNFIKCAKKLSK